jgi:hypothetical protein
MMFSCTGIAGLASCFVTSLLDKRQRVALLDCWLYDVEHRQHHRELSSSLWSQQCQARGLLSPSYHSLAT